MPTLSALMRTLASLETRVTSLVGILVFEIERCSDDQIVVAVQEKELYRQCP
jgi:hypothetical protein